MQILFDFEIDRNIPHVNDDFICHKTREFFIEKFKPVEAEIDDAVEEGKVGIVVISVVDDTLRTIPINIPFYLFDKLNGCIKAEEFDAFQDDIIEKFGLHTLN